MSLGGLHHPMVKFGWFDDRVLGHNDNLSRFVHGLLKLSDILYMYINVSSYLGSSVSACAPHSDSPRQPPTIASA